MWVGEFKAWHKGSVLLEATKGVDGYIANYYLNAFTERGRDYLFRVALCAGAEKEKLKESIRKDPRIRVMGVEGDQVFFAIEAKTVFHKLMLDHRQFMAKPIIHEGGWEYWTVASWRKEDLTGLYDRINSLKGEATAEILSIKERRLNLFLPNTLESLTEKQRGALERAYRAGYYSFPRKASLEEIASRLGVPRTTFQSHLRKAEKKIVSAVVEQMAF